MTDIKKMLNKTFSMEVAENTYLLIQVLNEKEVRYQFVGTDEERGYTEDEPIVTNLEKAFDDIEGVEDYSFTDIAGSRFFLFQFEEMENLPIIDVTYVSVGDGGTEIETSAKYNTITKEVFDIESTEGIDEEGDEVISLDEEYIVLPDGKQLRVYEHEGKYVTEVPTQVKLLDERYGDVCDACGTPIKPLFAIDFPIFGFDLIYCPKCLDSLKRVINNINIDHLKKHQ